MPAAIKARSKPVDFENLAQKQCEDREINALSALTNDLDNALRRHFAGGVNHSVHDVIRDVIVGIRRDVVVLYAEDLVKVQPGRKSCKREMCGAMPCISLGQEPTEYECVINQKIILGSRSLAKFRISRQHRSCCVLSSGTFFSNTRIPAVHHLLDLVFYFAACDLASRNFLSASDFGFLLILLPPGNRLKSSLSSIALESDASLANWVTVRYL